MQGTGAAARRCIGHGTDYAALLALNFVGVWLPSLHASAVEVEIEKPTLHVVGVQDWLCKTLVLLHVAALNTALVMCSPDGK